MSELKKICPQCKSEVSFDAEFCKKCGAKLKSGKSSASKEGKSEKETVVNLEASLGSKSRMAAGLLAIFVGTFGIHNFYLGFNKRAVTQLLIATIGGVFTCGVATSAIAIWALVEGILILTKANGYTVDSEGKLLGD